jgi:hypothetical protein
MGYIPKKMTNNNLYTAGDQFVDPATGNTYTGSYYELFDGTVFSGKTLNPKNQELFEYGKNPTSFIPQPQGKDYQRGQIERYFAKKRNSNPFQILEIDSNQLIMIYLHKVENIIMLYGK